MSAWATGVAEVIAADSRGITVKCPHCERTHSHGRAVLGSKSVVAGCHTGRTRCREYRIVDLRNQGKPSRKRMDRRAA